MHEDIGAALPGDEAITFGIVKPFYFASFLHFKPPTGTAEDMPAQKAGAQSGKKTSGTRYPHPFRDQHLRPCFQSDLLTVINIYHKNLSCQDPALAKPGEFPAKTTGASLSPLPTGFSPSSVRQGFCWEAGRGELLNLGMPTILVKSQNLQAISLSPFRGRGDLGAPL
jgi:hypothetical protein